MEKTSGHTGAAPVRDRKIMKELEKLTDRSLSEFGVKKALGRRDSLFHMSKFLATVGQAEAKMMELDLSHSNWPPAIQ